MESSEIDKKNNERAAEVAADAELDALLSDKEYAFLTDHPKNRERIENAESAIEALDIALDLIAERLRRTFEFRPIKAVEGVEMDEVNLEGIRSILMRIKEEQELIGDGGDAYVVVSKNEINNYPPEICYKFAKQEKTPRGRNAMAQEAEIQGEFYAAARSMNDTRIGVPMPFYVTEMGNDKMIAMEKLPAKSVDDILRGKGYIPDWLDIDAFCNELLVFIEVLHEKKLYHRDMHPGNIMIRQSDTPPDDGKWGYMIDFGLSGYGIEGMDPYRKQRAGETFTYSPDDAIINSIRHTLKAYRNRLNKKGS